MADPLIVPLDGMPYIDIFDRDIRRDDVLKQKKERYIDNGRLGRMSSRQSQAYFNKISQTKASKRIEPSESLTWNKPNALEAEGSEQNG